MFSFHYLKYLPDSPLVIGSGSGLGKRILILTFALIFFIVFLTLRGKDDSFLLLILGLMASLGIGFLFALALGILRFNFFYPAHHLFKHFLDSMSQGFIVTDRKGHIVYVNPAYRSVLGLKSFADIRTIEDQFSYIPEASSVLLKMKKQLRDGKYAEGEFRLFSSLSGQEDTSPFWYRLHAQNLEIPDQKESFCVWQLYDVSQERLQQENLALNLQKIIDHLNHAPAGFFSTHEDERIFYLNATLAEWLEIDLNHFSPDSLFLRDIIAREGVRFIDSVKVDCEDSRDETIDLDFLTVSGKILPVRLIYRIQKTETGNIFCAFVLNRSKQENSQEKLHLAEMRFSRFFNSIPMAIAGLNSKGQILCTNAVFLSLFSSLLDKNSIKSSVCFQTLIHESHHDEFQASLVKACNGETHIAPIDTIFPDNDQRHIRFYINSLIGNKAIKNNDKEDEAVIIYAMDITEQRALESQMAQTQKMQAIGQLAGGIAHDFNNVLTGIIMSSDLLLTNHRLSDPSFPDIMNIKQNANRAASLVRQLLAFSRKQTLRAEVFNLIDVLADLRLLLIRLIDPEIKLTIDHGRDLWPLKTDIGQFEQVIVNLVVNAGDAIPQSGTITIRTSNVSKIETKTFAYRELFPADYVLIEIEDNGVGISVDLKEKIFEPFFTTKEIGKGTGLGLSMVYGIVKQTGGLIFCDSELGKGTIFRIFLPRHISADEETEPLKISSIPDNFLQNSLKTNDLSGSATILLVEDEDSVRMGSVRALEARGYKVHEASSGIQALKIFKTYDNIDLIVSDVVMPEMDGPTLLGEVRKLKPNVKFVFVSGYAEDAFSRNLPPDEKFVFLSKPFSLKQLAVIVKKTLEEKTKIGMH